MKDSLTLFKDNAIEIRYIVSEPGDLTRYDYIAIKYHEQFMFVPLRSPFRFPQSLSTHTKIKDVDKLKQISKEENCNPYTLKECLRTMEEWGKDETSS